MVGTRSNSSRKLSGTPLSSVGGSSAFARSTSIISASRSFSPLAWSSAGRPRIISKALASSRNAADMFSGCGTALALVCACGSDVSTSSSCEKKVDRSGRRVAGCDASSLVEILCSTTQCQLRIFQSAFNETRLRNQTWWRLVLWTLHNAIANYSSVDGVYEAAPGLVMFGCLLRDENENEGHCGGAIVAQDLCGGPYPYAVNLRHWMSAPAKRVADHGDEYN